ncbi:MAG TPA: sigma-54 dependent transcriptional regulator [Acidobacteriota bacterium]|nr:sigma-54 dependent transcriptional regulator [Acidobacteriota bacterium]
MSVSITILVVDDDRGVAKSLFLHLNHAGYDVLIAHSYEQACKRIDENPIDLVISDLKIGTRSGIEVISYARQEQKESDVIIITAYGDMETAIEAMKLGARDYLIKPLNIDELLMKVGTIAERKSLSRSVELLRRQMDDPSAGIFFGEGKQMKEVHKLVQQVANTDATVLLEGESGTGKNVYGRYIHSLSERRDGPFVIVNTAALPENIIESELFGHRKGAFTGAIDNRRGLFEQAAGGTILLDEISEMPLISQPKLLHVLEQGQVRRVGDDREIALDCRVLIATNRNLQQQIANGEFRQDLYYRIAVLSIYLPPLRERAKDIEPLSRHFLAKHGVAMRRQVEAIDPEAIEILQSYSYPGNIRELDNIIQRAIILCEGDTILPQYLPIHLTEDQPAISKTAAQPANGRLGSIEDMEVEHIRQVLRRSNGNIQQAAKTLGIARSSLWRKMKKYGIKA